MTSTLYLDRRGLALSLQSRALVIHQDGKYVRSIPLNMIDRIVCRANVELKTSVLANLADADIGISLFGGRRGARPAHLGVSGTRDVERRLAQYGVFLDDRQRPYWASRLVGYKLMREQRFLQRALLTRPDRRRVLVASIGGIVGIRKALLQGAHSSLETLRGMEGAAARLYFKGYAAVLPEKLGFTGRNRRPPRDPVNALLSLGYTLLNGQMVQAITSSGLDVSLGIYHEPAFGRDSLASDLVELYRCDVDRLVWDLVRERVVKQEDFYEEDDACLLTKAGRARFYPAYQQQLGGLLDRARRLSRRLAHEWVEAA